MADTIQIRGGSKAGIPALADRELGWCNDSKELFIGTADGNVKIGDAAVFQKVMDLETGLQTVNTTVGKLETALGNKLTAAPAAAQAAVASDAELAAVIEGLNSLIAALKNAGIMST